MLRRRRVGRRRLPHHDHDWPGSRTATENGPWVVALLWPHVLGRGVAVDSGDRARLCRPGDHRNRAHGMRAVGLDESQWPTEGPGMPAAAGTLARSGLAHPARGAQLRTAGPTSGAADRGECYAL